jgi:hypothetical protein
MQEAEQCCRRNRRCLSKLDLSEQAAALAGTSTTSERMCEAVASDESATKDASVNLTQLWQALQMTAALW